MRIYSSFTVALLALSSVMPLAYSHPSNCSDASDQRTLNECTNNSYKESDSELNKLYKEIKNRLNQDPDSAKKFVAAQRSWITFRDAECDFATANSQAGSAYGMLVSLCRDRLTQARIKEFKAYLSCEEGDLSCPVSPKDQ